MRSTAGAAVSAAVTSAAGAVVDDCLVSPRQRAHVSVDEAGTLAEFPTLEGTTVEKDQLVGRLGDERARIQLKAAQTELTAAEKQAANNVNVRFADRATAIAQAELDDANDANRRVRGTVTTAEVRRRRFEVQRAAFRTEQAQMEFEIAALTRDTRMAELDAARHAIARRQLQAPFGGVVVEIFKHEGEWVNPGDPVYRIVRLDQLWVEGFLSADTYLPSEIADKPVTVTARITSNRNAQFRGRVVFVSPEVDPISSVFRVKALVENQLDGKHWLLRPGLKTSMTIHLTTN